MLRNEFSSFRLMIARITAANAAKGKDSIAGMYMLKLPALLNARTTITTKLTSDSSARTSAVIPLF